MLNQKEIVLDSCCSFLDLNLHYIFVLVEKKFQATHPYSPTLNWVRSQASCLHIISYLLYGSYNMGG